MPSHLRLQSNFEPFSAETTRTYFPTASSPPPQKKQKMSLTQTYYIAASARTKLGREASRPDHNLRLLVGHANLLDSLMLDLQEAEREQDAWFNETVKKSSKAEESAHIQWADTVVEEREQWDGDSDTSDSDSDSDSDIDDGDFEMITSSRTTPSSPRPASIEEDEDMYEDEEYDEEHALTRVSSAQPPELVHDEDSDDESPPTSPPQITYEYTEKQKQAITTTGFFQEKHGPLSASAQSAFDQEGFFIPERNAPLIAAA